MIPVIYKNTIIGKDKENMRDFLNLNCFSTNDILNLYRERKI